MPFPDLIPYCHTRIQPRLDATCDGRNARHHPEDQKHNVDSCNHRRLHFVYKVISVIVSISKSKPHGDVKCKRLSDSVDNFV